LKEITVSDGSIVLVDDEDYEKLSKWKWRITKTGYVRRTGRVEGKSVPVYIHREIMLASKGIQVDHINGNKLDNRKENLRLATRFENQRNVGKRSNNKSGYKGVRWVDRVRKWRADIRTDSGRKFIGQFNNKHDAARAYNEAALKYHGKYAFLNEIKEDVV